MRIFVYINSMYIGTSLNFSDGSVQLQQNINLLQITEVKTLRLELNISLNIETYTRTRMPSLCTVEGTDGLHQ
jgi:hypothetical protein